MEQAGLDMGQQRDIAPPAVIMGDLSQRFVSPDGQSMEVSYIRGAAVPLNVTGLPGVSMRFGTSKEGLPISIQVVGSWQAESTILHLATMLESVSPVRDLHPDI